MTKYKCWHNGEWVDEVPYFWYRGILYDVEAKILKAKYENKEVGIYATWFGDPSTQIMLHYMTIDDTPVECLIRKYGITEWQDVSLFADKPFPMTNKRVRWFKLEGLEPNTIYETKLKNHEQVYKFKTMPSTQVRDIKFAMTSDQMNSTTNFSRDAKKGFDCIKSQNIDALILAGDIVHDDGTRYGNWELFWQEWFDSTKRNDNWITPLVTIIGNHDGRLNNEDGSFRENLWANLGATSENITFWYNFFSSVDLLGYGVIDIGDYFSLMLLNSGHTALVKGTQTNWLSSKLAERTSRNHIFPIYHVNAYPLKYNHLGQYDISKDIQDDWSPLFTQYGVKVTGSGHDHMALVTKKVTTRELDDNGVIYVGNGHGMGTFISEPLSYADKWFVDYLMDKNSIGEIVGFDFFTFKNDESVELKKINLDGEIMYQKTL